MSTYQGPQRDESGWERYKRRVGASFTPGFRAFIGVMLLIMGVALTVGSSVESQQTQLIAAEGVTTTADVLEANETRRNFRTIQVDATVRFTTPDGQVVERKVTDCGERDVEPPGSRVRVTYARSDPSAVQFADLACRKVSDSTSFVIAGWIALAAGALLLWNAWRARRSRNLTQ